MHSLSRPVGGLARNRCFLSARNDAGKRRERSVRVLGAVQVQRLSQSGHALPDPAPSSPARHSAPGGIDLPIKITVRSSKRAHATKVAGMAQRTARLVN